MSTDNIGATLPPTRSAAYIFHSGYFPPIVRNRNGGGEEGSVVSRHVYQLDLDRIDVHPTVEPVPGPDDKPPVVQSASSLSHGCHQNPCPTHGATPYNSYPPQSAIQDPLFESQQGQGSLDPPPPDASRGDEFPLYGFQGRHPAPHAFSSASSSLEPGAGPYPRLDSPDTASIPEGRQFPGVPTNYTPVENSFPFLRSHEDQQLQEVQICAFSSGVIPIGTNNYQANDVEVGGPQASSRKKSHGLRRVLRQGPAPRPYFGAGKLNSSSSRSSAAYASSIPAALSQPPADPQHQNRAENTRKPPKKKHWCSSCGGEFSQSQVLGRHIKDVHEAKQTCPFCASFTWSRGRPYLYHEHLQMEHPRAAPFEVREKGLRYSKENLELQGLRTKPARSANYLPLLIRGAPLPNISGYPPTN